MSKSDEALFAEVKKGNKLAFDQLFRKYYPALCKFAFLYVKDSDQSQELVQDMFVALWNEAESRTVDNVKAYLYTTVKNRSLNFIDAEKRHSSLLQTNYNHSEESNSTAEADIDAFNAILQDKLADLPDKCREIFLLTKFEGLSYEEVADYLKVSVKTIENQMGIAFKKLREAMLPYFDTIFMLIWLISFLTPIFG